MEDKGKMKDQLINELVELRQRIIELETSETQRKQVEEALKESEEKYRCLYEKMKDMAQKDPLTDLFNHGRINELLEHEIERSKRGSHVFSIMMLDVDNLNLSMIPLATSLEIDF